MKKLSLILFLIVSSMTIQSQELTWHTDVNKASEIAMKSKKPLLFFFTGSDWCGWCMRLQKEVLQTPEFAKWAKENVVLVELDFPRRKALSPEIAKQNKDLEQLFAVRGYPSVWFAKPTKTDGKLGFEQLGKTGYVAGGPANWLLGADAIIAKK